MIKKFSEKKLIVSEADKFAYQMREIAFNFEDKIRDIGRINIKKLNACEERLDRTTRKLDKELNKVSKLHKMVDKRLKEYSDKMDSLEDTFFTLYHNIKKNQWLYAQEPEDWWDDYLDLKRHYKALLNYDLQNFDSCNLFTGKDI